MRQGLREKLDRFNAITIDDASRQKPNTHPKPASQCKPMEHVFENEERSGEDWGVAASSGFASSVSQLRDLILGLVDMTAQRHRRRPRKVHLKNEPVQKGRIPKTGKDRKSMAGCRWEARSVQVISPNGASF